MDESSPFLITEDAGTLRIAWDNRRVPKINFVLWICIPIWIIAAAIAILATFAIFLPGLPVVGRIFALIWSVVCWVATVALPYSIIARTWSEWIEISKESLSYGSIGFLARKPKILPMRSVELSCGFITESDGTESMITLNVFQSWGSLGGKRRHMIGYWLATELKVQVFETIEEFVKRNQVPLKVSRYGPLFEK